MSLAQLPDELLISVFEHLTLKERHRSLPLVSRRCWQLLCSPQLLHTVEVSISGSEQQATSRLRSLALFIIRRGAGSVRRLQLDLGSCGETEETAPECLALLAAAATACSGLQELEIDCEATVTLSSWLLPLAGSLRRLHTRYGTPTVVAGSLQFLTALQDLELALFSDGAVIKPWACLPVSLTRLALSTADLATRMPTQIAALPNLRHLHIRHCYEDAASYAPLTRLSLQTLELSGCVSEVPECLSALTTLQCLAVDGSNMGQEGDAVVAAGLAAALPHLRQLTRLDLALSSSEPLASLTALSSLRWLCWWWQPQRQNPSLPSGSWLQQLQTLAAPQGLVAASLPALAGAQRLEQLCVYNRAESTDDAQHAQLRAVIRWAAQRPFPQQLLLGDRALHSAVWPEVGAAARLRPGLSIAASTIDHDLFD